MFFLLRNAWLFHRHRSVVPAGGGGEAEDDDSAQSGEGGAETTSPAPGVLDELSSVLASGPAVLSNFLELLSLEARRAGLALMWMVAWGFVAAICIVGAWLGLLAAVAMWAVSLGFPPIAAAITFAAINLAAGSVLIYVCIGMSGDLLFSATRRQVAGLASVKPPAP